MQKGRRAAWHTGCGKGCERRPAEGSLVAGTWASQRVKRRSCYTTQSAKSSTSSCALLFLFEAFLAFVILSCHVDDLRHQGSGCSGFVWRLGGLLCRPRSLSKWEQRQKEAIFWPDISQRTCARPTRQLAQQTDAMDRHLDDRFRQTARKRMEKRQRSERSNEEDREARRESAQLDKVAGRAEKEVERRGQDVLVDDGALLHTSFRSI